ncbi:hypothetical protein [Ulvibacterium marinum]|uniref:XRE family transcriptional regulator n=1 Tax=Ulvibacterium marinum TaxID=2419782 RepID=A0A3B0CBH6_9FLAO|nr:hypothetical protein [Ulvibacterium marinum]RKN80987.1 hypothetical protein D7Z94_08525 [Ulvibacterium marinum]
MLKTIDRLMQFIKYAGLSARKFDISIGASNGYTLRMKKNHASIGSDVIENIVKVYPQLNVVWLITGEGKMLKDREELMANMDNLSLEKQQEIEQLIEHKIRLRQEEELKRLLKEITEEIEQTQKKMGGKD